MYCHCNRCLASVLVACVSSPGPPPPSPSLPTSSSPQPPPLTPTAVSWTAKLRNVIVWPYLLSQRVKLSNVPCLLLSFVSVTVSFASCSLLIVITEYLSSFLE